MPSISSTYLIPAVILNPAFILHLINTFVSYYIPPHAVSQSPHPRFEKLGPLPGSTPYLDMHANDQLCWSYTILMVIVQVFAFGKVSDNRTARKIAKATKIDKERIRREKLEKAQSERQEVIAKLGELMVEPNGTGDFPEKYANGKVNGHANGHVNGIAKGRSDLSKGVDGAQDVPDSGESATETSEEEMMI